MQDAKSAYKRPPRGQSTRAGGSPSEIAKQHALHTPGGGVAFNLKGLGGHPSNRSRRRTSEPATGRAGLRRPKSSTGVRRVASAATGVGHRVQSAGTRRRRAPGSAPASANAWGVDRPAVDVDVNPDGDELFGSDNGVDMRFGITPMAQRRSARTPTSAPARRRNSPREDSLVATGDGWVPVPPMGELSAISAASEHGFTPPAGGVTDGSIDLAVQQLSPRSSGGSEGSGGGDVINDPRFRAPQAGRAENKPPMSPMTASRDVKRRAGAQSRGSETGSSRQRRGRYGERGNRKPLTKCVAHLLPC